MDDKKLAIATPLLILAIMILFAQFFVMPRWFANHQTEPTTWGATVNGLQLLGYNYNRDVASLSVALWNRGGESIKITGVSYDGVPLAIGEVGAPNDLLLETNSSGMIDSGTAAVTTPNAIIFPSSDHWNLYTYGPTVPVVEPNGMVTLYLGVTSSDPGTKHMLVLTAESRQFAFEVTR